MKNKNLLKLRAAASKVFDILSIISNYLLAIFLVIILFFPISLIVWILNDKSLGETMFLVPITFVNFFITDEYDKI